MLARITLVVLVALMMVVVGCEKKEPATPGAAMEQTATDTQKAAEEAKPAVDAAAADAQKAADTAAADAQKAADAAAAEAKKAAEGVQLPK